MREFVHTGRFPPFGSALEMPFLICYRSQQNLRLIYMSFVVFNNLAAMLLKVSFCSRYMPPRAPA